MSEKTTPTINEVRAIVRPEISNLPILLSLWQEGKGLLADVPILPANSIAPRVFKELKGTVRAAGGDGEALTLAGLLETDEKAVICAAMVATPADFEETVNDDRSKQALATYGNKTSGVPMEVVALLGSMEEGGPAFGVLLGRPLFSADPEQLLTTQVNDKLKASAKWALKEDLPIIGDLANHPWEPLGEDIAPIWAPFFAVVRTACMGLAIRSAKGGSEEQIDTDE